MLFGSRSCHSANAMFEISKDYYYYLVRIDAGQCGRILSVVPAEDPRHIGFGPNETDHVSRRCASLVPVCSARRLLAEMIGLNLGGGGSVLDWLQRSSTLLHRPERSVSRLVNSSIRATPTSRFGLRIKTINVLSNIMNMDTPGGYKEPEMATSLEYSYHHSPQKIKYNLGQRKLLDTSRPASPNQLKSYKLRYINLFHKPYIRLPTCRRHTPQQH